MIRNAFVLLAVATLPLAAQQNVGTGAQRISDPKAAVMEVVLASVGASLGVGYSYAALRLCGRPVVVDGVSLSRDDNGCLVHAITGMMIIAPVSSTIATRVARRYTQANGSTLGALLGSAVGTFAGLRLAMAIDHRDAEHWEVLPHAAIVLSQGTFAVLGSRLVGMVR
jgi:hypothetical protein